MTPNEVRDKMCIYYGVSPSLTYKNQEHVFPAGLGGNKKLPNDYVSEIHYQPRRRAEIRARLYAPRPAGLR